MRSKAKKALIIINGTAMTMLMVGAMYAMAISYVVRQSKKNN